MVEQGTRNQSTGQKDTMNGSINSINIHSKTKLSNKELNQVGIKTGPRLVAIRQEYFIKQIQHNIAKLKKLKSQNIVSNKQN